MNNTTHHQLLKEFISKIDEQKFYDAHESLETIWFPRRFEQNNEIKLLKGFINAAVSFELLKRGKPQASKKVWNTYLKYKALLDQVNSPHIDMYHFISQYLENINKNYPKVQNIIKL